MSAQPDGAELGAPWDEPIDERIEHAVSTAAALNPISYDRTRTEIAEHLGVRVSTLDAAVAERRAALSPAPHDDTQGRVMEFPDVEPWPEPVDGAELLDEIVALARRYVVLPAHADVALALWVVVTYVIDVIDVLAILVLSSPEKRCGKTTLLAVIGRLVRRPITASNISPAAMFRAVEMWSPTLLIDEADTFLRASDELRGVVNSGHTRDAAYVIRTVGDDHEPRRFSTWGPKVISGIGDQPDTIMDRAIVIALRRRLASESVRRLRHADRNEFDELRQRIARWAHDNAESLRKAQPKIPDSLDDRASDNWGPLLAIADLADGAWPEKARAAALALSGDKSSESDSVGVQLLRDVREIFSEAGIERIASVALAERLAALVDRPWAGWARGKPITPRHVAKLLRPFGIIPGSKRLDDNSNAKGYDADDFREAYARYAPERGSDPSQRHSPGGTRVSARNVTVTEFGRDGCEIPLKPTGDAGCDAVTDAGHQSIQLKV